MRSVVTPGRLRRRLGVTYAIVAAVASGALALESYLVVSSSRLDDSVDSSLAQARTNLLLAGTVLGDSSAPQDVADLLAEAALGFGNDFGGADSRLLGVSIENGIVTLDLSSEFRNSRGPAFVGLPGLFQLAHVVYTVTQFPEIEGVRFKLEGRPLQVPAGTDSSLQGILPGCDIPEADELLDRPVTREDYESAVDSTSGVLKSVEPTDGTFQEYLVTLEFDAPKHLVYKAWTTPELVERWWWSGCGKVTAEIDLEVGGTWRYQMVTGRGDKVAAHGTYREIVPNERIVLTAIYDVFYLEPKRHELMLNTLTFTEADGRTTLTILVQAPSKNVDVVFGQSGEHELERVADSLR